MIIEKKVKSWNERETDLESNVTVFLCQNEFVNEKSSKEQNDSIRK